MHDEWFSGGEADDGAAADGQSAGGGSHRQDEAGIREEAFGALKGSIDVRLANERNGVKSKVLPGQPDRGADAALKMTNELLSKFKDGLEPHIRVKERDFLTFEPRGVV